MQQRKGQRINGVKSYCFRFWTCVKLLREKSYLIKKLL
jgi:hypothetical protein